MTLFDYSLKSIQYVADCKTKKFSPKIIVDEPQSIDFKKTNTRNLNETKIFLWFYRKSD